MPVTLIADSGATKCEWRLLYKGKQQTIITAGLNPYFYTNAQVVDVLQKELVPHLKTTAIDNIAFYGSGLGNADKVKMMKTALRKVFPTSAIEATHDLLGAAHATCGIQKGIVCILGTGCNSGYFNGKKIAKNSPGLGYVLGDEGSGSYLGKKVIQYYLYNTFDEELHARFNATFNTTQQEILANVYTKPFPSRYLAGFAMFLVENRGHYMIENILEDGINDFFFTHLCKYAESWKLPIHFVGSVAFGFKDVLAQLCHSYEFEIGTILQNPMEGLVKFHTK